MKKIALFIILIVVVSCNKKDDNKTIGASRSFNGSVSNAIHVIATTTTNTFDQKVDVKITYTNDNGTPYLDSVKIIDISSNVLVSSIPLRSKGSVNNLSFNSLPLNKQYTCLFIRNGSAPYPDTLIKILGN